MLVWSFGGGTQSAAIAVMILTGLLPKPDIAVMADTSRECSETWLYLTNIIQPALDSIDLKIHIADHRYAYVDLFKGPKKDILLPMFTRTNGRIGKFPTFCSNEWKQRPIRRWLREKGVKQCSLWLGISTDEADRMKANDVKWCKHVFPLIEIVPTNRHQCRSLILSYGWPEPPKSRCWMCSNMSPASWQHLKKLWPDDFNKAVNLESEIQKYDPNVFLHPLAKPLETAVIQSSQQSNMFDGCDSGYCWT